MQDDPFELKFVSNEQDFIYNFGVNKGHTLSFSKVNRCYFLSAEAKQLYHNICDYAWGAKRECRPSQATLRAELGWGRHSMDKYLNELRVAGLIMTEKRGNKMPLLYRLNELHRCEAIIHSEVVHQIRETLGMTGDPFHSALDYYIKAGPAITDPLRQREEIHRWFQYYNSGEITAATVSASFSPASRPAAAVDQSACADRPVNTLNSAEVSAVVDPRSKKRGKIAVDPDNAETWNSHHFRSYFADLYKTRYETGYQSSSADVGQMARLIRSKPGQKEEIRNAMVHFIGMDFFTTKTLSSFCSGFVQTTLDHFFQTGKLPDRKSSYQSPRKNQLGLAPNPGEWDDFKFQNER